MENTQLVSIDKKQHKIWFLCVKCNQEDYSFFYVDKGTYYLIAVNKCINCNERFINQRVYINTFKSICRDILNA